MFKEFINKAETKIIIINTKDIWGLERYTCTLKNRLAFFEVVCSV